MTLLKRVAIVTGAASGLGRATAQRFVDQGASVILSDLATSGGEAVAQSLGSSARFHPTDITKVADVKGAFDLAEPTFGHPVNVLINCAGVGGVNPILADDSIEAFKRIVDVNLVGSFNVVHLAAQRMAKAPANEDGERGVIINVASIAAFDGGIAQSAYAASKGGVAAMTLPLAREFSALGIRINTVAPGLFDTAILSNATPDLRKTLAASIPFPNRMGRPEEFARFVEALVDNTMMNGEIIRQDGGLRMGFY